jgi:hypothetical protein
MAASRCAELTSSPSMLLQAPEGRALVRFKRELESVAEAMAQRSDSSRDTETRTISLAQRGLDSLMQILVRVAKDGSREGPTLFMRRGDSLRVTINGQGVDARLADEAMGERFRMPPQFDAELRELAPRLQATIRSLQPQIAALSLDARTRLQGKVSISTGWLGLHLSESKLTIMSPQGTMTNYCDFPVIESIDVGSPAERGGLAAGDTVLAYNGRDVRANAVNYAELLVPGQQLRVRVKRGGKTRELSVLVAARPPLERTVTLQRTPCPSGAACDRVTSFAFTAPPATTFPPSPPGIVAPPACWPGRRWPPSTKSLRRAWAWSPACSCCARPRGAWPRRRDCTPAMSFAR